MNVQYVDPLLVERIRVLARNRQCSVNDVMLLALRNGLGLSAAQEFSENLHAPEALIGIEGHWEAAEQKVFQETLQALAQTRATQLSPETIRYEKLAPEAE